MSDDILQFSGDSPTTRIGQPGTATEADALEQPTRRRGLIYAMIVLAGLSGTAAVGYLVWTASQKVALTYNELPITNAGTMLEEAESLLTTTAAADEAPLGDDSACYFAPDGAGPTILCGPIWLGVSEPSEPWLEVLTAYDTVDDEVTGSITGIGGPTEADTATFQRPDSTLPPDLGEALYPTTGRRLGGGSHIADPDQALAGAEEELANAVAAAEADSVTIHDDARCFFLEVPEEIHGVPITDSAVWCGPVRTVDSDADEVWLPIGVRYGDGPTFGSVIATDYSTPSTVRPREKPDEGRLVRPDGAPLPDATTLDRPPRPPDFAELFETRLDLDYTGEGRLVTEDYEVVFDGFGRVDSIGSGGDALIAADGHDLVVARVAPSERTAHVRGVLLVDGSETPLPTWRSAEEGATLVLSVPEDTTEVDLMVETSGRSQTISLINGSKEPGYPMALYRESPVALDQTFAMTVAMPIGDPVIVEASLAEATWSGRRPDGEWLPTGQGMIELSFDDFDVDRPCCEVVFDATEFHLRLIDPTTDTTFADRREDPTASPGSRDPLFIVPEDLTRTTLEIEVTFEVEAGDETETIVSSQEIDLALP